MFRSFTDLCIYRALLQIRAVQKIGQVTHPALPVEQDAGEMPVPPGYQCVSLIEALNGPISNPNPAPAAPPVAVALQSSSEKKNRRVLWISGNSNPTFVTLPQSPKINSY